MYIDSGDQENQDSNDDVIELDNTDHEHFKQMLDNIIPNANENLVLLLKSQKENIECKLTQNR